MVLSTVWPADMAAEYAARQKTGPSDDEKLMIKDAKTSLAAYSAATSAGQTVLNTIGKDKSWDFAKDSSDLKDLMSATRDCKINDWSLSGFG
eukprot:854956-Pyramimonas_sp.AAC.1